MASMVVRDELDRYLRPCVASLLGFCDALVVLDDGSTDGTGEWLRSLERTTVVTDEPGFFAHEGKTRQKLLEITLAAKPGYVLAIDADEFVADGQAVRRAIEGSTAPAFSLCMSEVWKADRNGLKIRRDGRWGPQRSPIIWKAPARADSTWVIPQDEGGGGRVPKPVIARWRSALSIDVDIYHFGWANEEERRERHARYASRDSFGHNPQHIASILFPDSKVGLDSNPWPRSLDRAAILEGVRGKRERRYTLKEIKSLGWREP